MYVDPRLGQKPLWHWSALEQCLHLRRGLASVCRAASTFLHNRGFDQRECSRYMARNFCETYVTLAPGGTYRNLFALATSMESKAIGPHRGPHAGRPTCCVGSL